MTYEAELDRVFYPATGRSRGRPFHAYTKRYIYFVVKQEDGEFIRCIPKYPGSGSKPIHFWDPENLPRSNINGLLQDSLAPCVFVLPCNILTVIFCTSSGQKGQE